MGFLDDIERRTLGDPSGAYLQGNEMTPQQAADTYRAATDTAMDVSDVTAEIRERAKADRIFDGSRPALSDRIQNPVFRAAVAGDEKSLAKLEDTYRRMDEIGYTGKLARAVSSDGISQNTTFDQFRNSAARGIIGVGQMGNINEVIKLRSELDILRKGEELGNLSPRETVRMREIEDELRSRAKEAALAKMTTNALSQGSQVSKIQEAYQNRGLGAAIDVFFSDVSKSMADLGSESAAEYGAMAPVVALFSSLGVIPGMAATLIGSVAQDMTLGFVDRAADLGYDTTNADDLANFFLYDTRFSQAHSDAIRHALPVGIVDAASFGIAGKSLSKFLPTKLGEKNFMRRMPPVAQAYETMFANTYARGAINLIAQGQVQGMMGAAGEALGQLAERGEIYDPLGVAFEYVGEHFTAPMEVATATMSARHQVREQARVVEETRNLLTTVADVINNTPSMQESQEARAELAEALDEQYPDSGIAIDMTALQQQGEVGQRISDSMMQSLPSRMTDIETAISTGGSVEVSKAEYLAILAADKAAQEALINASHMPGNPTSSQLQAIDRSIVESHKVTISRFARGQSQEFLDSLRSVATELDGIMGEQVRHGQTTERANDMSLILSHVATAAKDAGMLPAEVWNKMDIRAFATDADFQHKKDKNGADLPELDTDANGNLIPVTEAGRHAVEGTSAKVDANTQGLWIPATRAIVRLASGNRSTLLHETGHWFMASRVAVAMDLETKEASGQELTESQKRFLDVTSRALKWLGVDSLKAYRDNTNPEADEKFARTYEQYLKEGYAPSSDLRYIFRRFSAWLKKIYGAINSVAGSDMSDDVRELFDDLFTSHEQVQEAKLRRSLFLTLEHAKRDSNGNITDDAVQKAFDKMFAEYDDEIVEEFRKRGGVIAAANYANEVRRRLAGELTEKADAIRKRYVDEELEGLRDKNVLEFYKFVEKGVIAKNRKGEDVRVKPKYLVKDLQKAGLSDDQIITLERAGLVAKKNGQGVQSTATLHAHAALFGFTSVGDMCNALVSDIRNEENNRKLAEWKAEERMHREHPEISSQEQISESADIAVFNATCDDIVAMEIAFLENAASENAEFNGVTFKRPVNKELFRHLANTILSGKKVSDLNPASYRQAATNLATQAAQIAYSDPRKAAQLKRQQLVQIELARQAQEIKDQVNHFTEKMAKKFREGATSSMPLRYRRQIQNILFNLGVCEFDSEGKESFADFYNDEVDYVYIPQIPQVIIDGFSDSMPGSRLTEMTSQNAQEAMRFVDALIKASRERNLIDTGKKKADAIEADTAIANSIEENAQKKGMKPVRQNEKNHDKGLRVEHALREFRYNHGRFQNLWEIFEGKEFGEFFKFLGKRIDDCASREDELRGEKTKAFAALMEKLRKSINDRTLIDFPELGGSFDKEQIIAMALNIGNRENFDRLLDGSDQYVDFRRPAQGEAELSKWTREQVLQAIGRTLTADELHTIQEVWNLCGSLGEELSAIDERTQNKDTKLTKPERVALETADGKHIVLDGGYYPVEYDRYASVFHRNERDKGLNMNGVVIPTRSSATLHSEERTTRLTGNPISLTTNAGFSALNDVIHDVCWREALIDLNKLIGKNTRTAAAIRKYWGAEAIQELDRWMQDVASNGKGVPSSRALDYIRKNVSITGLGFNPVTMLLQPIGMTQSIAVVGGKWCGLGMVRYLSGFREANRQVATKSAMMRARMATRFKELVEVQRRYDGSERWIDSLGRVAFSGIAFSQMQTVDVPTWLGAYEKHLAEGKAKGLSGLELEDYAVSRADRLVIKAQGSGRLADLSAVERKKDIFNVFYSFFGTVLNATLSTVHTKKGMGRVMSLMMILGVQPIIESFLRAGLDQAAGDDDGEYLEDVNQRVLGDLLNFYLGQFKYIREVASVSGDVINKSVGGQKGGTMGYAGPTGAKIFNDFSRFAQQVGQGEVDKGLVKAFNSLILGDVMGLPSVQMNRVVDAFVAAQEGKDVGPINYIFGYKGK